MKKIMILVATIVMTGAASVYAQTPAVPGTTSPTMQQSDQRASDWTKIETSQIPASLQQTLQADRYKGWESSGVYYNRTTEQYSVDAKNGATTNSYRFDKDGIAIPRSATGSASTAQSPSPKP